MRPCHHVILSFCLCQLVNLPACQFASSSACELFSLCISELASLPMTMTGLTGPFLDRFTPLHTSLDHFRPLPWCFLAIFDHFRPLPGCFLTISWPFHDHLRSFIDYFMTSSWTFETIYCCHISPVLRSISTTHFHPFLPIFTRKRGLEKVKKNRCKTTISGSFQAGSWLFLTISKPLFSWPSPDHFSAIWDLFMAIYWPLQTI